MFTCPTGKDPASRQHKYLKSAVPLVILAIHCAAAPFWLSSAGAQAPTVTAAGNVLDRVERKIVKEPKYVAQPRYALLVFGTQADSQVWMVEDGKSLYIDRNANGDLTDDGAPIVPANVKEWTIEGSARFQFDYVLDEITPTGGARHSDFCLHRWNYGEKEDSYGLLVTLDGQTPMYAGWFGTFWSESPKTVPFVHFGGPMQPKLLRFKEIVVGSGTQRLSVGFMNPGRGEGGTSRLSIDALPQATKPVVRIDWPVADGAPSLQTSHTLMQRCCYWEFYDPDFKVPPGVSPGTARATVSLSGGAFPFEFTTDQIEFPVRANNSGTAVK
jgi:hypothetical protein